MGTTASSLSYGGPTSVSSVHTSSTVRSDSTNNATGGLVDLGNRKISGRNLASSIKKRFSKKTRRFHKQSDYGKILRDFLSTWSTENLIQLVNDYETSSIIKEFYLQSELARPTVANVASDLQTLYDCADAADVYLEFKGKNFPVHKSIVCARCPLFRELLGKIYTFGTIVPIQIDIPEITCDLFSNLLSYLYSGEMRNPYAHCGGDETSELNYSNLIESLAKHAPNDLAFDLKHLLDTGIYSDVKLVFKNASSNTVNCNDLKKSDHKCKSSSGNQKYNLNRSHSTRNATYNSTSTAIASNSSPSKSIRQQQQNSQTTTSNSAQCAACSHQSEYSCHAAVLASRSRFFRNLVLKYQKKNILKSATDGSQTTVNTSKQSIKIVLDEQYIKRRYISIVLNVIYCDGTNILNLLANCVCKCSPNKRKSSLSNLSSNLTSTSTLGYLSQSDGTQETNSFNNNSFGNTSIFQRSSSSSDSNNHHQANTGNSSASSNKPEHFINEIIDLFVISKFLELEILTSLCENLLVDAINLETVARLLDWSEKTSGGSEFVRRQCLCFLREEFSAIATSPLLCRLSENQLIELIRSDFLQASEDEVLRSILEWSKSSFRYHDSLSAKLVDRHRKVSIADEMLIENSELMARLIKHLRIAHILPLDNELLKNALQNEFSELATSLPPYMLQDGQTLNCDARCVKIMAWINLENRTNFLKPRLFQPFHDEARNILAERLSKCEEINFIDKVPLVKRPSFSMPDNLYMVDDGGLSNCINKINFDHRSSTSARVSNDFDLTADQATMKSLKEKFSVNKLQIDLDYLLSTKKNKNVIRQASTEHYLRVLPIIRPLNLEEKYEILIYIRLRVLREHNLPDEMLYIFDHDEPEYETREKVCLDMNLKRRSLNVAKNRKFSVNSIDLENYLAYDSVAGDESICEDVFNESDNFDHSNNFNQSDNLNSSVLSNQNDILDQDISLNRKNSIDITSASRVRTPFHQIDTFEQTDLMQSLPRRIDPLHHCDLQQTTSRRSNSTISDLQNNSSAEISIHRSQGSASNTAVVEQINESFQYHRNTFDSESDLQEKENHGNEISLDILI